MRGFLKKLRASLFREKDSRAYFLYALGEILLVVIGILIAIQISKWSDERKDRVEENKYYCRFLNDLQFDIIQLDRLTAEAQVQKDAGNSMLLELAMETRSKEAILAGYALAFRSNTFVPNDATLREIISSGNLGLLEDEKLRDALLTFYSELENLLRIDERNYTILYNKFMAYDYWPEMGFYLIADMPSLFSDKEIASLKTVPWHEDENHPYFVKLQDAAFTAVVHGERKQQIINIMKEKMTPIIEVLEQNCEE